MTTGFLNPTRIGVSPSPIDEGADRRVVARVESADETTPVQPLGADRGEDNRQSPRTHLSNDPRASRPAVVRGRRRLRYHDGETIRLSTRRSAGLRPRWQHSRRRRVERWERRDARLVAQPATRASRRARAPRHPAPRVGDTRRSRIRSSSAVALCRRVPSVRTLPSTDRTSDPGGPVASAVAGRSPPRCPRRRRDPDSGSGSVRVPP